MASASAPNRRSGSISGSGSHEIDVEVEPPEYQALLLDTERERPPVQQREGKVESILTWLQNPFKSKSPRQQAELTSISVELPVPPNVTGARRREGRMASFTRSIRNCVGGTVTRSSRVLSLTDPLAAKVIAFMSNAFLVGILTLNIFSATYLLAWRKESNSSTYTGIIATAILCLIVFLWGCCCHQPKGLRYLVLSKCCCPDVDEDA